MLDSLGPSLVKAYSWGAHRSVWPEQTLAHVRPLASRIGITRLGNVTGLDYIGIPVAIAVRPRSHSVAVSQGKGPTLMHAMASAFMEATELFHGEELWARVQWSSTRELSRRERVLPLDQLSRTERRLTLSTELPWIKGWDLADGSSCWVPVELVYTDYKVSTKDCGDYFLASSNGLASGNHILEAVSAGICEVIERDAVALWERRGTIDRARCRIDLSTVDDPLCLALLGHYERSNIAVQVWDVTSDCEIPVFVSEIHPRTHDPASMSRRSRGVGCHVSRAVALSRALTEAAQVRLTHITGVRDDIFSDAYEDTLAARVGAALLDACAAGLPPRAFSAVSTYASDDIREDVLWLLHRLRSAGFASVAVVDLTRPEFGIPVVRVIVPGLEGYSAHPAYRPGPRARRAEASGE
ncbi:YcaO-like family protein [Microvirga arabica]|uniref:YcaO-like family protein n=1 Tax=Microvirga arabica TaxID=1128671 RepID=UPI00193A252F|nr:YcaO-like family protein [Microvirga arabica]MBM1174364.1 YcaO-like family protein [Microvirga arabica]